MSGLNGDHMSADTLGSFELVVLAAVLRLGTNAYGVTVSDEIHERTGNEVSIGAVYTTLERLERKGFVSSRMGEKTVERGGRRKKYFRAEANGILALRNTREQTDRMLSGLNLPRPEESLA